MDGRSTLLTSLLTCSPLQRANVGGPEKLLAGRPDSWEAGYVEALLHGTVGDDPVGLAITSHGAARHPV